ncbi:hypothetical protein JCM13991_20580 [Thermodesulfovibrio hydrogeniphilus]
MIIKGSHCEGFSRNAKTTCFFIPIKSLLRHCEGATAPEAISLLMLIFITATPILRAIASQSKNTKLLHYACNNTEKTLNIGIKKSLNLDIINYDAP